MIVLGLLVLHCVVVASDEAADVLQVFKDRIHVAACRAGCGHMYRENARDFGQCWTVCHMMSTDLDTWTRVCQEGKHVGEVCQDACQHACNQYTSHMTQTSSHERIRYRVDDNIITIINGLSGAVYILTSRDSGSNWYELGQTQDNVMEMLPDMEDTFLIRVSVDNEVAIIKIKEDMMDAPEWELYLDSIIQDGGIFNVKVYWDGDSRETAVKWSVGPSIVGVVVTNDTRVQVPAPPLSRITVQVTDVATGVRSDSLTVDTPDLVITNTGSVVTIIIAILTILSLLVILSIVINLYKRTKMICSGSDTSSETSLRSNQNKSIISFDTFINKNKIKVPSIDSDAKVSVQADLYVI